MLGLYYKIWVDAIVTTKAKRSESGNWKLYTIAFMSLIMGVNLFTFFVIMKSLVNRNLPLFLPVTIFYNLLINAFISIVLTFFVPFVILNYLLIFNNDRYKKLITKYKSTGGKLYRRYALLSLGILIIPALIVILYF